METKTYGVKLIFTEPLLGTVPMNRSIYDDYIATRASDVQEDELQTVAELTEKGTTGFHRLSDKPILYDYVLKGFFKDACGMLRRVSDSRSAKLTKYKKVIDGLVFIEPRRIPLTIAGEIGILERPLRAQTAQGERIALSRSEMLLEGSSLEFNVRVLGSSVSEGLLREWFEYGASRGLGQWRNASYGRFTYNLEAA